MYRLVEYTILFIVVLLLQVFVFNNLTVSVYLTPLVYVAFVVLLPMETPPAVTLLTGTLLGVAVDYFMGTAGINTMATAFIAFIRSGLLGLVVGKDLVHDGGIPSPKRIGAGRYWRYAAILIGVHAILFFLLEAMTLRYMLHTLARIVLSGGVTLLLVRLVGLLFESRIIRKRI